MKRFMLAGIAIALAAVNPQASADEGRNGGHGGSYHSGGGQGGSSHGDGHGPGYGPPPGGGHGPGYGPPPPQGKNNKGRRSHYGNGSTPYYYGGWHNDRYRGYGHGYYYPRPYYGRPYYPYRSAAYPYYGYPYYGQHHNNNNHNDSAAYLIGGLVVGSLLTNAYHNSQANAYAQQAAPVNQVVVAPQGRRLLRDLNGNCFERTTDGAGNELRTELPPSACNW